MKALVTAVVALVFAMGSMAAHAEALSKSEERGLALKGVTCEQHKQAAESGETHRCLFTDGEFDGRDFATERGRSAYVISEIAHRCKEIEILDDVAFARIGEAEPTLRRVSAQCIR